MGCEVRIGFAKKRRCDLEIGINAHTGRREGTLRRRRVATPIAVEGLRWVAARVLSGCEFAVADDLAAAGFVGFAPFGVRVSLRASLGAGRRGRRERDFPVMVGYVFVGCPEGLWLSKLSHDRILDVLGGPGGRGLAPSAIAALADLQAGGFWDRRIAPALRYEPGAIVRVVSGPFSGWLGVVEAMPSELRVMLRMALLGGDRRVSLATGQIENAAL